MTNEELFNDLKQFVDAKIDGVEQRLGERVDGIETRIDGVEQRLTTRMDKMDAKLDRAIELIHGVSEVVTDLHKGQAALVQQGNESERRIERLEHKLA